MGLQSLSVTKPGGARGLLALPPWTLPLAAFAVYEIAYLVLYLARPHEVADPAFSDFYAFWSFARFVHAMPAAAIYDPLTLQRFQHSLREGFVGFYPFPYPPIFLLWLWPFGWLGFVPAFVSWIGVTLGLYLAAVAGRDWRAPRVWLALVAPTTLYSIIFGQNGFLSAALMIGGLRLLGRRPYLGGALLGALLFKPQFLVLVPLVLLAARQWQALVGLLASASGQTLISALAFGPRSWLVFVAASPSHWRLFQSQGSVLIEKMPTVTASLMQAGLGPGLARAAQAIVAAAVAVCLWRLFRQGAAIQGATIARAPRPLDAAALQVGVFLVTPYAFVYDMPMVTSAVATVIECCTNAGRPWRGGETLVLIAALLLPIVMLSGLAAAVPIGPIVLGLLFAVIARVAYRMPAPASPHTRLAAAGSG